MLPNLKAWLKKVAKESGPVWSQSTPYLFELQARVAEDAKVPWKHNALRHSFISYRVATIKNVDQVALEAGNSPEMIFEHYRELVTAEAAEKWFGIEPSKRKGKERKARGRDQSKAEGRASSAKGGAGERDSDAGGGGGVMDLHSAPSRIWFEDAIRLGLFD